MRSIPFSTPMVQANAAGRKSQTRRTRGLNLINEHPDRYRLSAENYIDKKGRFCQKLFSAMGLGNPTVVCPYGKVGDILYVRETWMKLVHYDRSGEYGYKADLEQPVSRLLKWKPSIFMPQSAARTFIKITDIKLQQLIEITEEDAIAEGIGPTFINGVAAYFNYITSAFSIDFDAKLSYQSLWLFINGKDSWNPSKWVWRISYEILTDYCPTGPTSLTGPTK